MELSFEQRNLINRALIYAVVLAWERATTCEANHLDGYAEVSDSYQSEALAFAALREELRKEWDKL